MANQNGRNSSMSDDDRMSWRPQDDDTRNRRDDEERMYGRDRDDRRSWDDRWDRGSSRSIDRGGQGQSGYGAGRYEGDRSFTSGYDDRFSARNRFDNYGNYLGQGGQQMGRDEDRDFGSDYRSGYRGQGQGGYGSYGDQRYAQQNQQATHGYGSPQGMGVSGGYTQHSQGMQGYGQQQGTANENAHQYGNTGAWGNYGTPSWNTGSAGMNMGQPGVGGSYNAGYQGGTHGYIGADRPFSHHYGSPMHHGQSNFAHQGYSHLGQQNFGHLGPQPGAHMSGGGMYQQGPQRWGNEGYQQEHHESLGQRIKGWFQGHRGKGPMGYARSDERIRETVCEALSDDDRVDASNIEVTVKNGEVTLTGTVDTRMEKRMAEECVENLSGVKDVQNQIRVSTLSSSSSTTRGTSMSQNVDLSTTGSGTSVNQNGTDKRHKA